MAYNELYCDFTNGSNMNGGAPIGGSYPFTYTNGNWDATTGIMTVASGNPQSDGVTVGDFAGVYNDGATVPVFGGRVTARTTTTITVSLTAAWGTPPTTNATARTIKVGGAYKGPNAAVSFPFNSVNSALTDATSLPVRINFKNNATYAMTSGITSGVSTLNYEGYTSSAGDGGKAIIDGSTNAIALLTSTGTRSTYKNFILQNNGSSGSNFGISSSNHCTFIGLIANTLRGSGFVSIGVGNVYIECEAYACNSSNTASLGGFTTSVGATYQRCYSHDNAGSNGNGLVVSATASIVEIKNTIFDTNAGIGVLITSGARLNIHNSDFYNNTGNAIDCSASVSASLYCENTNFIKNGGTAVVTASGANAVRVVNCGFGSGTQANGGTVSGTSAQESGSVTYATDVTPYNAPTTGDFRITLSTAKNTGRGVYTQNDGTNTGSLAYPDLGAVQHTDAGAAGGIFHPGMTGGIDG